MQNNKYEVLKNIFGYDSFRPGQEEIIDESLNFKNKGVLVVAATSYGKSLCFQIPALVMGGLNIIISPLISLMKDQVDTLNAKGVGVACYNSSMSDSEKEGVLNFLQFGQINLLYVAPERFEDEGFVSFIKQFEINIFAIDEAHCVSQYADFRPSYTRLEKAIKLLNPKQVIAVTATATPLVQNDICDKLGIPNAKRIVKGFYRDNLILKVTDCEAGNRVDMVIKQIAEYQKTGHNTGIVYVGKRKDAEYINDEFNRTYKINSSFYHAGLSAKDRTKIQDDWFKYGGNIVSTTAFAMGINKSDVRYIIHAYMPSDIDDWVQQIGRAGRDNKKSICKTFLSFNYDYKLQRYFIDNTYPSTEILFKFWKWINDEGKKDIENVIMLTQEEMAEHTGLNTMLIASCISILKKSNLLKTLGNGKYQLKEWYAKPEKAPINIKEIEERRNYRLGKLKDLVNFFKNNKICRMKYIMDYFGESGFDKCGKCDICLKTSK